MKPLFPIPPNGNHFHRTIEKAIEQSRLDSQPVELTIAGVRLTVTERSKPEDVFQIYLALRRISQQQD